MSHVVLMCKECPASTTYKIPKGGEPKNFKCSKGHSLANATVVPERPKIASAQTPAQPPTAPAPKPVEKPVPSPTRNEDFYAFCHPCKKWYQFSHPRFQTSFHCPNGHLLTRPAPQPLPQRQPAPPVVNPAPAPPAKGWSLSTLIKDWRLRLRLAVAGISMIGLMVALVMFLLWPAVEKQKPPPDDGKKRLPVVRDQPEATPRWDWGNGPKPALLVRLRSLDALGERASLFGKAIEHQEVFDQFQNSLAQALAPAGRPAINWNRPWAVYTLPDKQFAQDFVALIPIPAPENFLELVENSKMRVIKNKEGTYTFDQIPVVQISNLQVGQFPVQLPQLKAFQLTCRFIEGYVCLSSNPLALQDGKLLKPEVVFADKVPAAFTASYFLDDQLLTAKTVRTWQDTADILLEQMKQKDSPVAKQFLDMTKQVGLNLGVKELAIPPDNLAFARRLFHLTTNGLLDLVQQGEEISFRLDIKPTSENLEMELLFRAKENSNLAKTITSFGTWPSLFGGLRDDHAEFNIAIHFKLPDEVCQAIAPYVRASTAQVLKENQNDPFLPMGEKFLRTCEAAVLGGELDLALSLRRDDKGKINVVGGFKLNNAQQLEEVFKEEWKHLAPRDQQRFKFDLVRVDDVNIHQINTTDYLPQLLLTTVGKVFFYHAFRQDAVMWSMGESGLELLKEAVQAKPQPGPLLLVGGNALWNANNKQSRFSFALEGGDALRFRHTLDLSFVAFVYKLMQQHQR